MESLQVPPPPHHYAGLDTQMPGVRLDPHGYIEIIADPQDEHQSQVSPLLFLMPYTDRDNQAKWHKILFYICQRYVSVTDCWVWNTGSKRWQRDTSLSNIDITYKSASSVSRRWPQHPHTDQQSGDGWKQQHQWKRWIWGTRCTRSGRSPYQKSASFRVRSSTTRWQPGGSAHSTDQETLTLSRRVQNAAAKSPVAWIWIERDMKALKLVKV